MAVTTINIDSQVLTFANLAGFPITGTVKTIYIAEDTNFQYYWDGSQYVLLTTDINIPANLIFYATTAPSSVAGYEKLVISPDDPDYDNPAVDVPTGAITTTAQLVGEQIADANIFAGNPGVINISTIGEIRRTSGTGTAKFYFEVYQRTSLGVETLRGTSNLTLPISGAVYQQFQVDCLFNNGTWLTTDRVVIKFYADRVAGGSNPNYDFLFGGANPVRTLFPISAQLLLNVPIAIGITGVTGGVTNQVLITDGSGKLGQSELKTVNSNSLLGSGDVSVGTVTSIATAGLLSGGTITSSGTITTSINTNRLVGRSTAGVGVMEEITIGSGLTLSGGTLTAAGGGITIGTTAIASGTVNRILFEGAGNVVQQDSTFVWNNTDKRLILGTEAVADTNSRLVVIGKNPSGTGTTFAVHNSTGTNNSLIVRDDGQVTLRNSLFIVNTLGDVYSRGQLNANQTIVYGFNAGRVNTGTRNTFIGDEAGRDNTSGSTNVFIGDRAGALNTTFSNVVSIGSGTGSAEGAVVIGRTAIAASNSVAIGLSARAGNSGAGSNIMIGRQAGEISTTATACVYIGDLAGTGLTTGQDNTAIGTRALRFVSATNLNVALGRDAGAFIADGVTNLTASSNSVFLGAQSRANSNSQSNQIAIGYQAIGLGSNSTVIGNSSTTLWKLWGAGLLENVTAPSLSVTDNFHIYSNDITAGNAAPHFRTENGDVVRLYRVGGWGLPTGSFTRTTFDTTTVTLEQLAERVAALIQDLRDNHQLLKA